MISLALTRLSKGLISYALWSNKGKKQNEYKRAVLAIATVAILVSSTAIAKPALASSNKDNNGNSVSKSDLRSVGNFLKCIGNHGGNDISKKKAQKCIDNYLV